MRGKMMMKKMMKHMTGLLLTVLLLAAISCPVYANSGIGVEPGQDMPDFTVSLTDGTSATLSELLKEKELVVLNVFASWCGPCEKEFPDMEKVYQANSDKMVILSVSGDPDDTLEKISDYKASHNLSFPMGIAGDSLDFLAVTSFPTTVFITREGKVGFTKVGAFVTEGEFEEKVNTFLSPDYDGKPLEAEKASHFFTILIGIALIGRLIRLIGRWLILSKAGKKGWHSLIPFLKLYDEYAICWNGWFGVAAELCLAVSIAASAFGLGNAIHYIPEIIGFLFSIPQGFKLAKAFGKGKGFGVLLAIPLVGDFARFILGVSKAQYQAEAAK